MGKMARPKNSAKEWLKKMATTEETCVFFPIFRKTIS
jgi:hypothetical protein